MSEPGHLYWIIKTRIEAYENDVNCCIGTGEDHVLRIIQDKVIIQELKKILYGKGIERLSYVSHVSEQV